MPNEFDTSAPERRKSYWNFFPGVDPDAWKKDYLEAIYHHLNVGVYYCAAAMNSIIDHYTTCDFPEDAEKALSHSIANLAAEYSLSWLLSFIGNWATIIILTQTATSKLKGQSLEDLQEAFVVVRFKTFGLG